MNVKPRLFRKDINCVNCGECIEACYKELGRERGVFSFSQSKPDVVPPKEAVSKSDKDLYNLDDQIRSECYEKTCH